MYSRKSKPCFWEWCRENSRRFFLEFAGERKYYGYKKETLKKILDRRQHYDLDDVETTLETLQNEKKDRTEEEEIDHFDSVFHDIRFSNVVQIVPSTPNSENEMETQKESQTTTSYSETEEEEEMKLKSPKSNK